MSSNVFNYNKTDYERPQLLLGQAPGLFDTVNKHYPEIWSLYKTQKSLDWDENEFDYSSCVTDFEAADRSRYDMMIKTLAWQWEADSVASRAFAPLLAPFITSTELWAAWLKVTEIECLTPDHDVLTTNGWKSIAAVTEEDKVAQWNQETKEITFINPIGVMSKHYKGLMYEFHNAVNNYSQVVTANHRMPMMYPYQDKGKKWKGADVLLAKDVNLHGKNALPVAGYAKGTNDEGMTPLERLLVAVQADGSITDERYTGERTGTLSYRFSLNKQRKIDRLIQIATEAGYEYDIYEGKRFNVDGQRIVNIRVPKDDYNWNAKSFDWIDLEAISLKWCQDFIEELAHWDGSIHESGNIRYISSDYSSILMAQLIGHMAGLRGHIVTLKAREGVLFPHGGLCDTKEVYQIYFSKRDYMPGNTIEKFEQFYDGMVYCLEVPDSFFMVRRNGAISITGNCLHAATYSEIVRNSFKDPSTILDEILKVQEAHERLGRVVAALDRGYEVSHLYALGKIPNDQNLYNSVFELIVAFYCMERIQFMASFAVTFAICDTGLFQPIGKAVQKIAQDELEVHAELARVVLAHELTTVRGKTAIATIGTRLRDMIDEVITSEMEWVDYLFSEGRELVGLNPERLKAWTRYSAYDVYNTLGLKSEVHDIPKDNPLRFMEKWLNISKTQASPQEQDIAAYKVGILQRTDEGETFDIDF